MFKRFTLGLFSFFILTVFYCGMAFAIGAGGFRNEVVSARGMGRGSANVAQTDDAAAVHYNPAAITYLRDSRVTLGYTLEMPRTSCNTSGGADVDMQSQDFFIPNFYLVDNFGMEKFSFGLGVTAPYGLSTDWADDSFAKYVSTETDLEFYNINPTVAYRVNDKLSVGLGFNYSTSEMNKFKKVNVTSTNTTLGAPATEPDGNFQLKGDDNSWGYNIGILYRPSEEHTLGVSYRSEMDFKYDSSLTMDGLGSGATAALFGATYNTVVTSELTLPQSIALGYAYKVNDKLNVELDVEWTGWSSVEQDLINWDIETNATRLAVLNADNPSPKDWDDVYSVGFGVDYKATDKLTLRCGYLFEETPVPEESFDTPLPDANRHGISFGVGYRFKGVTVDASYLALFFEDRDIDNNIGSSSGASIDGKYEQFVNIFGIGFTYTY